MSDRIAAKMKKPFVLYFLNTSIVVLLLMACIFPTGYRCDGTLEPGGFPTVWGPLGPFVNQYGWYANVFLSLCLFSRSPKPIPAMIGIVLAASACGFRGEPGKIEDYVGGGLCRLASGFYCWWGCFVCNLIREAYRTLHDSNTDLQ